MKEGKELGTLTDPGPVVEEYVQGKFEGETPVSRETEGYITELERIFAQDEETEE